MLFVIGISLFISFLLVDVADSSEMFEGYADGQNVIDKGKTALLSADNLFLFIIVGLSMFVIIGTAIVRNHPTFFIISFFALAASILFAAIMSNAFFDFYTSPSIIGISTNFPKILFLMDNLPFYLVFMGLANLIAVIIGYNTQ